jgi:hypothetical protein
MVLLSVRALNLHARAEDDLDKVSYSLYSVRFVFSLHARALIYFFGRAQSHED